MNYDLIAHLPELRSRVELANRRATLMASLGPVPTPDRIWPFNRRRVKPLAHTVEIAAYAGSRNAA